MPVIAPQATYERAGLPNVPSEAGDIDESARQIRDPFVFDDEGKTYLFYATAASRALPPPSSRCPDAQLRHLPEVDLEPIQVARLVRQPAVSHREVV